MQALTLCRARSPRSLHGRHPGTTAPAFCASQLARHGARAVCWKHGEGWDLAARQSGGQAKGSSTGPIIPLWLLPASSSWPAPTWQVAGHANVPPLAGVPLKVPVARARRDSRKDQISRPLVPLQARQASWRDAGAAGKASAATAHMQVAASVAAEFRTHASSRHGGF